MLQPVCTTSRACSNKILVPTRLEFRRRESNSHDVVCVQLLFVPSAVSVKQFEIYNTSD
jgi:hypothetical protein